MKRVLFLLLVISTLAACSPVTVVPEASLPSASPEPSPSATPAPLSPPIVLPLTVDEVFYMDVDADGASEELRILNEDADLPAVVLETVREGAVSETPLGEGWLHSAYLWLFDGESRMIVSIDAQSSDYYTVVYAPGTGVVSKMSGRVDAMTPSQATVVDIKDVLGTWAATLTHTFDGTSLIPDAPEMWRINTRNTPLTVKQPLPIRKAAGESWEDAELTAGEAIVPYACDGEHVYFTYAGGKGRVAVTWEGYATFINGVEDSEYLDGIVYSG